MLIRIRFLNENTPRWVAITTIVIAIYGACQGRIANDRADKANSLAKSANDIAEQSNIVSQRSLAITDEIHRSREIPRLVASPSGVRFYFPKNPETPTQAKIDISAIFVNFSDVSARSVALNFETLDWDNPPHPTSLFQIYRERKHPIPHLLKFAGGAQMIYPSYSPDVPNAGEAGFLAQDKPFRLKLALHWDDVNDKKYVWVGFYTLEHAPFGERQQLYFQPEEAYDSVKDGAVAWKYATEGVWFKSGE